nr:MAG TPA: hypothetical protein [Caudoviricetes sp.]
MLSRAWLLTPLMSISFYFYHSFLRFNSCCHNIT